MKKTLALLALPVLLLGLSWSDSLYRHVRFRHHNRHLNHAWLDTLRMTLEEVRAEEPANESCLVWLSRVLLQLGDYSASRNRKLAWYAQGRDVAADLRGRNPRNPEGHLWWGNAQARLGEQQGVMKSLFMAGGIKHAFDRSVELRPDLTLGLYALGRYHYELPGVVGGNMDKAEQYWLRALKSDPHLTLCRISLAWVYRRRKMWDKAREFAQAVLDETDPEEPASWVEHDCTEAREVLVTIPGQ